MKTILSNEDVKNIFENIFNGNLKQNIASGGAIPYANPNSENIIFTDEAGNQTSTADLAQYLNVEFYAWKKRLIHEPNAFGAFNEEYGYFEEWVQSLNFSLNKAYALVEITDKDIVASPDIDSAEIVGRVSFLVQSNKIKNLDYYVNKLQCAYAGHPQEIQNSYGDDLTAFIVFGALDYEQEPIQTPLGECVVVFFDFRISYIQKARTYSDMEILLSFTGDDIVNSNGEVVDINGNTTATKYKKIALTNASFVAQFINTALPTATRPDLTGAIASGVSNSITLTFYDFDSEAVNEFNALFWAMGAYKIDNVATTRREVNVPMYVKVKTAGQEFIYKCLIDNMQKALVNNDFNVCSISLKTWGKIS